MNISRLSVIINPFLIWLLAQAYLMWPGAFYYCLILQVALIFLTLYYISGKSLIKKHFPNLVLCVVFLFAVSTYILFSASVVLNQILLIILVSALYNYFKVLYYQWNKPDIYSQEDEIALVSYLSFLLIFFSAADLYGLQALLNLNVWPMLVTFLFVTGLTFFINLKIYIKERKVLFRFVLLNTWIILEMAIVFVFMPTSYDVSALALAIVYYLIINLSKLYIQESLTVKKTKLYLILSITGLAILLITAPWLN